MRSPRETKQFRRDVSKIKKSGRYDINKLEKILKSLIREETLSLLHQDHALKGKWLGYRDCHIQGDCVLIYKIEKEPDGSESVLFVATGNHSNLLS